jgi:cytochrome b involved in lipid metabolism
MKLQGVFLLSILAFAKGQMQEVDIIQGERILADRAVAPSELATHATYAAGLWTSLGGIVYDITNFGHPGGKRAILKVGGRSGDACI